MQLKLPLRIWDPEEPLEPCARVFKFPVPLHVADGKVNDEVHPLELRKTTDCLEGEPTQTERVKQSDVQPMRRDMTDDVIDLQIAVPLNQHDLVSI